MRKTTRTKFQIKAVAGGVQITWLKHNLLKGWLVVCKTVVPDGAEVVKQVGFFEGDGSVMKANLKDPKILAAKVEREHTKRYPEGCGPTWAQLCEACCQRIGGSFEPHPEVVAFQMAEGAKSSLVGILKSADENVERFRKNLAESPAYAFEWADGAMRAAARIEVCGLLLKLVSERGLAAALAVAEREALRGARFPSRSTFHCKDQIEGEKTAAWAEFVEGWKGIVSR